MSGGTPTQYAVLLTLIGVTVAGIALYVLVGRVRRARAVGSREAGSVRSKAHAGEIADRLYSLRRDFEGSQGSGGSSPSRVRVRGAARLLAALSADSRFEVAPRRNGDEYWSFAVTGTDRELADAGDALCGRMVEALGKNGVTAVVSHDMG